MRRTTEAKQNFLKKSKDCFILENFFTYSSEKINISTPTKNQFEKEGHVTLTLP